MDPADQQMRKREAQRRLSDRRRRVGELRSRAIAISVICFALLWAVVFVQMATGNDPVLGGGRRAVGASAAKNTETAPPQESEPEALEPEALEPEPIGPEPVEVIEPEPEPLPVETAQS